MRLYLDESVPQDLRYHITGHVVATASHMRWLGRPDGEVLPLANERFDAVMTCDQSVPEQQNLTRVDIRIIILHGRTNTLADLMPLLPEALKALEDPSTGQVMRIYPPQ